MIGRTLAHYEIIGLLGKGGMGEVYRARDTRLDRDVALKTLPEEFASDRERLSRFEREAKMLAALNHPNILSVHDVGRADGTSFFVMELLEGQSLRQRFDGSAVPWRKAVEIVSGIAEGLAAAHARGTTHRDLKPENIFLTHDGVVKVLDFGLAQQEAGPLPSAAPTLTRPRTVMGTPAYMAPEQASGSGADARSDIFALGCVLHELLSGAPTFRRDSAAETLAAVLRDEAASLCDGSVTVPAELDRIVARCLDKDPQQRFQSVRDLAFTLKGLAAGVQTPVDVDAVSQAAREDTPSIAVLPFTSMSADPENEFFSDGVSEEIINALARLPGLQVAGRTSAFSFKGKNEDLRAIGEKLNVRTILEGSVRRLGGRVRVMAQLVNVSDGYHLWSERFDRNLEDIFEVQDEIARAITDKLQVTLGRRAEGRLVESQTASPDAYQSYVKGRALLLRRGTVTWRALEAFRAAVTLDPKYAQAWAGLADAYAVIGYQGMLPAREAMSAAERAMAQAMELGPELGESHNAAAIVHHLWKWDWAAAEEHYRRALQLNPRYIQARCWYGFFFLQLLRGKHEDALEQCRRAVTDDPLAAYTHTILGFALGISGHGDEGIGEAQQAIEYDPQSYLGHWGLQACYGFAGHHEEAVAQSDSVIAQFGPSVWSVYLRGISLANLGRTSEVDALYRELSDRAIRDYVQPTPLAMIAAALGRMDEAFGHVERALDERDPYLLFSVTPWTNHPPLHEDPRWRDVRRRMRLDDS